VWIAYFYGPDKLLFDRLRIELRNRGGDSVWKRIDQGAAARSHESIVYNSPIAEEDLP
jgi:hypothetical protein